MHSFWNQTSCINWQGAGSRDEPVDSRRLGGKTPVTMGAFLEGHLSRWSQETGWLVRTWKQGKWRCSGIATSVCSIDECVCVESPSRYHLASGQSGSSTGWRAGQKPVSSLCMIPHPPAESSALELSLHSPAVPTGAGGRGEGLAGSQAVTLGVRDAAQGTQTLFCSSAGEGDWSLC